MSHVRALLDRAKSGLLSQHEVAVVARELATGTADDAYTAIHVLGLMRATEHEKLVAAFLDTPDDPMLARIALQVLCSHWRMAGRYRDRIARFSRGVDWDYDEDVRIAAISAGGELLRESPDKALLTLLLTLFRSEVESHMTRQAAYLALARAAGVDWTQLPPASRTLDLVTGVDPTVLRWATERTRE